MITFRDVTSENINIIISLSETVDEELVAPNDLSISEWLLRDDAWLRAIYVEDIPVGIVMVQDIPDWHVYHIWRLMVEGRYQRKGFGRSAMERVIERYKCRPGASMLTTFVVDREGGAEEFYRKLGFVRDGRRQMGQNGMALKWAEPPAEDEWPPVPNDAEITLQEVRSGMLRTLKRIYLSIPEEDREGLQSPWTMIACSKLDQDKDKVRAICANGYPVGFVICGAQDGSIKESYIAVPYQEMGIEING